MLKLFVLNYLDSSYALVGPISPIIPNPALSWVQRFLGNNHRSPVTTAVVKKSVKK